MNAKHRPKFFCEFCDTEVPVNARFCPKCGRFFASVRCPNCGHTGEHSAFKKGCPQCGYAMKDFGGSSDSAKKSGAYGKKADDPLPVWVYIATFILLAIVLAVLYNFLRG
ncbi:zinc ribbon domain-containing protein [Treponema sp. OMZ 840]|uniref:zinc ribbon domain-containing protein n=1 Tax=Treponema sp. OMZ 840 TaxID=244313 RepID=UPI003D8E486C